MTGFMLMLMHRCRLVKDDGAPGRIRTCDTRIRRPLLYPLSYEGTASRVPAENVRAHPEAGMRSNGEKSL